MRQRRVAASAATARRPVPPLRRRHSVAASRAALAALLGLPLATCCVGGGLLALCAPARAAPTVRDANALAVEELLRSARLWQSLGRPDFERNVLRKLLAVDGREARALFLLGELELRTGNGAEARRVLAALEASHPQSRQAAELQSLVRVYAQQKGGLADLRLAVRGGNQSRALALARALFPGGRAPGDLANEFAPLLASMPGGWENLRTLLRARIAADPTPADELTLYTLLAQRAETRPEALRGFAALSRSHDLPPENVQSEWRRTLLAMDRDTASIAEHQRFLQRYPADKDVQENLARIDAARIAAQQSADDPGAAERLRIEQALDAGALAQAEVLLQQALAARPQDADAVGLLGLLRLRQGRDAAALQQFRLALDLERAQGSVHQRWQDLALTAAYWSALQQARERRAAGDLDGAVRLVLGVQSSQPEQTEATHLLADLRAQQGQAGEAERLYRELLARDPGDARAWRGLVSLDLQGGRVDAALDLAQDLPLKANVAAADVLDAGQLRDAVERSAAGHPDAALRLLERGVRLLPRDPWLRYDLAQQYRALQLPELARQVMRDGIALSPELSPDRDAMIYAGALVDAATDRDAAALAAVEAIDPARRTEGMQALAQRLRFERDLRLAREARGAGRPGDDRHWREQALVEAGDDPDRRLRVAGAAVSADDPQAAQAIIAALQQSVQQRGASLTPAQQLRLLRIQIDAGDTVRPLASIARLLIPPPAGASEVPVRPAPDRSGASVATAPAAPQPPTSIAPADLLLLRARAHVAQHEHRAARADVAAMDALLPPEELPHHLEAVQVLDADRDAARPAMAALLARHPQDPDVLLEAARQAQHDHEYARAIALLRQVQAQAPAQAQDAAPAAPAGLLDGHVPLLALEPMNLTNPRVGPLAGAFPLRSAQQAVQDAAQQQLDAIEARRQPHVDTAWMGFVRHADDGISTLRGTEIPLLAVWPQDYDGHWFAQVDAVRLDAGTLPAPLSSSAQFGKVLALAPQGLPQAVGESAAALSAAGGWRSDTRRWDLGIVGAGFKVPNLVGGWRESREWFDTDVSAQISRRVLTGSLLSYAGAADAVTGEVWGGVTNTALYLRAGRDLGARWSGALSLETGLLMGRNVPTNAELQARAALDRDWIRHPDFRLNVGAALSVWHYRSNESFYTFGQGGYYSPQRYVSLGIPIEIEGRRGPLAYDLRVTPSHSWTYEQDTPYYPGNGALQALAGNPIHSAGAGGGLAGSLRGVLEYRATPHWAVGAWIDIDRSAYYAPSRAMIYLRYWLTPQRGLVDYPPHPVVPISLY